VNIACGKRNEEFASFSNSPVSGLGERRGGRRSLRAKRGLAGGVPLLVSFPNQGWAADKS